MGHPGERDHPAVQEAIAEIIRLGVAAGKPVGMNCADRGGRGARAGPRRPLFQRRRLGPDRPEQRGLPGGVGKQMNRRDAEERREGRRRENDEVTGKSSGSEIRSELYSFSLCLASALSASLRFNRFHPGRGKCDGMAEQWVGAPAGGDGAAGGGRVGALPRARWRGSGC